MAMDATTHRTTVDLDMQAIERAQEVLGTTTIRETIDRALHEVVRQRALQRAADVVREGKLNLVTPEDLTELRRVRTYG
jgi:Arc/MetJ family transcription regulator